ncbi:MAG: hypothetical protein JW938_07300 [Candidatus Omnitrophica bacterium]|nr:hypothetical protein [Candidatus Omnitrophota bacterium]
MKCPQCSHTSLFHKRISEHSFFDLPNIFHAEHVLKCKKCGIFFKHPSPYPVILMLGVGFAPAVVLMNDNFVAGSIMLAFLALAFVVCSFIAPLFFSTRIHFNTTLLENYIGSAQEAKSSSYELKKMYIGRWQVEHCNIA